jgi:hypothetical protein
LWSLVLAGAAVAALAMVQSAAASHPRPKGATPVRLPLVPAFAQCTAPNRTHGPPLAFPSCNPPVAASPYVWVGTADVNNAAATSMGSVKLRVLVGAPGPPADSDIAITASLSDVRCRAGVSTCGNANAADGPDYTGELQGNATIRITDHYNAVAAGGGTDPATVVDIPFPVTVSCLNTADTRVGGSCQISTTTTALGIPGTSLEGKRVAIELGHFRVSDGGPDGQVATPDNMPFAATGIFIP